MEREDLKSDKVLSEEQKKMISDNWGLLVAFYNKEIECGYIPQDKQDEFLALLQKRFCNSALSFEKERGFKFSTYVYGGFNFCKRKMKEKLAIGSKENSLSDEENTVSDRRGKGYRGEDRLIWNSICGWFDDAIIDCDGLIDLLDMSSLTEREKKSIKLYFLENKTYTELGEELEISRERARQIVLETLKKIREFVSKKDYTIEDFIKNT